MTNTVLRAMAAIILWLGVVFVTTSIAMAQPYVDSHYRSDGTYVPGHYRSNPDSSVSNNWSSEGNVNPYTGQRGTRPYRYGNDFSGSRRRSGNDFFGLD